jgi:SAM-dependent methyltransferase
MGLSEKYDCFYKSDLLREVLPAVAPRSRWPRDRTEAIVVMGGMGDRILDVGCGNGLLLWQFRHAFRELIGLEFSPHRIEQAKINLDGWSFRPVLGTAENMSEIETDSIDRIISADVIEHIPDVYAAAAEMLRVLKPGGVLVINTPNIAFLKKRLRLLGGRFPSTSQPNEGIGNDVLFDGGHLHYFTYRSLRIVLERAGFSTLQRIGFGELGWIHSIYPPLLSVGVQWVATKADT